MRILVTGSAGFVGRALVASLRRQGHVVIGLDRRPAPGSLLHDLRAPVPALAGPLDVVFHLASEVGGFLHNAARRDLPENEVRLLRHAAAAATGAGCRRLVYASSIAVFEDGGEYVHGPLLRLPERTPYARAKAEAERQLPSLIDEFVVLRPTNLFGAGQARMGRGAVGQSHVIPELLAKIRRGGIVEVLGDGKQRRNFLHVSDAVRAFTAVLRQPARAWLNLRSELVLSIGDLARQLVAWHGSPRELRFREEYLRYEPAPIGAFPLTPWDALGWAPRVSSLAAGLGRRPAPLRSSRRRAVDGAGEPLR